MSAPRPLRDPEIQRQLCALDAEMLRQATSGSVVITVHYRDGEPKEVKIQPPEVRLPVRT